MAENRNDPKVQGKSNDQITNQNNSAQPVGQGKDDKTTTIKREHDDTDHPHEYQTPGTEKQGQGSQGNKQEQGNRSGESNASTQSNRSEQNQGNTSAQGNQSGQSNQSGQGGQSQKQGNQSGQGGQGNGGR